MSELREPFKLAEGSQKILAAAAGLGLILLGVGVFVAHPHAVWNDYLLAVLYPTTIAMGSAFMIAVHYATAANWNCMFRRVNESMAVVVVPFGLLVLVAVFFSHHLYHWMEPGIMDPASDNYDRILALKEPWLNMGAFGFRSILYWVGWSLLILGILKHSRAQDNDGLIQHTVSAKKFAIGFIVFFGISYPFSMMDWMMTLEPHWFSSIYGVIAFGGSFQAALALTILLVIFFNKTGKVFPKPVSEYHLHDLAKLMFAFSCFWMYTWFSQFMLIWYAHLPEETPFFILRGGNWLWVSILLPIIRWGVPFLAIASQKNKRNPKVLIPVCIIILFAHLLDLYWLIMPSAHAEGPALSIWTVLFLFSTISIAAWVFFNSFGKRSPVPAKDPAYDLSLKHHY